jgi:acetyltransferase-like isoleucine patch superfamily enzyme
MVYRMMGYNIGKGVYIAEGVRLDRAYREFLEIGDGTSIMFNTVILCHQRDLTDYGTGKWFRECPYKIAPVKIGKKVLIGPNCVILPGATIGDGTIIAGGAVVHGTIPAYTLAMGAPVRVVKKY